MNAEQVKHYAQILFVEHGLNGKEVAEMVGKSEQTISAWKKKYNWELLQTSFMTIRKNELARLYKQLSIINDAVDGLENCIPSKELRLARNDVINNIAALHHETPLSAVIDIFMDFQDWLRGVDLDKAKDMMLLMDAYIKSKA